MHYSKLAALLLLTSTSAFADRPCEQGEIVTVARSFKYAANNGELKSMEIGTLLSIDTLFESPGRSIVDLSIKVGQGVRALTNNLGQINGCVVDYVNKGTAHVCVGAPGFCFATFDPKKMIFNECSIIPPPFNFN